MEGRWLEKPTLAGGGDLRAARRHLHARGHLRGRGREAAAARRRRHLGGGADAAVGLRRQAQLGLRRRAALRARQRVWPSRGPRGVPRHRACRAQCVDDCHHAYHVAATGESYGYYIAYADAPVKELARCLAEGFAYLGEVSPFTMEPRGEKSSDLPPACFVAFLQNHDQIANR